MCRGTLSCSDSRDNHQTSVYYNTHCSSPGSVMRAPRRPTFAHLHTTLTVLFPQVRAAASIPGVSTMLAYRSGRSMRISCRRGILPLFCNAHLGQPVPPAVLFAIVVCHFALQVRHLHHAFLLLCGEQVWGSILFSTQSQSCMRLGYCADSELQGQIRELPSSTYDPDIETSTRLDIWLCQRIYSGGIPACRAGLAPPGPVVGH